MFSNLSRKPSLIIFDLDLTLWPFDCIDYEYAKLTEKDGVVYENSTIPVKPFKQSTAVLEAIKSQGDIQIAVASASSSPRMGRKFIELFGWERFFDFIEIYPTSKTKHLKALEKKSGVPFSEMLFFDDLSFNIRDAKHLGVHAISVHEGMNLEVLRRGLESFARSESSDS